MMCHQADDLRRELELAHAKLGVLVQDADTLEGLRQQLQRERELRKHAEDRARVDAESLQVESQKHHLLYAAHLS